LVLEQRRRYQTKLPTNEFTRLTLKPQGLRRVAEGSRARARVPVA